MTGPARGHRIWRFQRTKCGARRFHDGLADGKVDPAADHSPNTERNHSAQHYDALPGSVPGDEIDPKGPVDLPDSGQGNRIYGRSCPVLPCPASYSAYDLVRTLAQKNREHQSALALNVS